MGDEMQSVFADIDASLLSRITEIRVRSNNFLVLVFKGVSYFVKDNGELSDKANDACVKTSAKYVDKLFLKLCDYSVYANSDSIKCGYITLSNGARVGVSGTAVTEKNEIIIVKDISSLNIRIPYEIKGCSDKVLNFLYVNLFPSIIVAGMPSSGKTTLLRDMAFQLSNGFADRYRKVVIVDERNELAGRTNNDFAFRIGANTDVLSSYPKAEGIELATRTLSPEMIICDEVSKPSEVEAISLAFSTGVSFALSVHIGSKLDLYRKRIIKQLIETGEFSYIVLLDGLTYSAQIIETQEVYREICRNSGDNSFDDVSGLHFV